MSRLNKLSAPATVERPGARPILNERTDVTKLTEYEAFLARKVLTATDHGIEVAEVNPALFGFQAEIVKWSLRKGRSAIFASTGLGKTIMQCEWAAHVPGRVLILAPLAVAPQTVREARKIDLAVTYARNQEEADRGERITITNYEMLDHFDPSQFTGVVLDESSILKSYTGTTKRALVDRFALTPFKLACTATPAPNDHMELGNHAEFLGVLGSTEMLARWFINDTMKAGAYRLKRHAEGDFWRWVASWAVCARMPSDVGDYDDQAFELPPLTITVEPVEAPAVAEKRGQLFAQGDGPSATKMWSEKAETAEERCQRAAQIVASKSNVAWVVWCETNQESERLGQLIPEAVQVKGADSLAQKESRLDDFATGKVRVLISKPSICGFGLNWQHCADVVFTGLSYSFESLFQAIRRTWRFGQTKPVQVHLITADSEVGILEALERKRKDHERMQYQMVAATKRHGVGGTSRQELVRVPHEVREGEDWTLHIGDNIESLATFQDDIVGLTVTSPPFSNLYIYSDAVQDMGNSSDHAEFFAHMDFLAPELYRVTKPGRLACFHCKDLPLYMNRDGAAGLYDFPGDLIRCMERAGWTFHSRVTIWKDPVTEMQRTKNHGLLHKNFSSRREVVRQGMADYLLVFRKFKGEDVEDGQIKGLAPVGEYIGEQGPMSWQDERDHSIQVWQRYASPVWFDINQTNVLQYKNARCAEDERHICPLQLDVIERCIWLWSNEGDLVLDPFMGIGSTGYCALKMGRRTVGCELKPAYARVAERHFEQALMGRQQGSLLELDSVSPTAEPPSSESVTNIPLEAAL